MKMIQKLIPRLLISVSSLKKSFGKSNCFVFRIFQTREKRIEEAESNKSSSFPQLKHCSSLLKAPLSFS